ncbi:MAG: ATP-binding protein [Vicinamibacterales bacterium]
MTDTASRPSRQFSRLRAASDRLMTLGVVATLLALAATNIYLRASWREVEDGVLWMTRADGVVAADVAPHGPAARAGVRAGDVLLAVNGREVERADAVSEIQQSSREGQRLRYKVARAGDASIVDVELEPTPQGQPALYFTLAAVAVFALLVGCAVRFRRPRDPATLHFFWLSVAFFGVFAFSFCGRFDTLDWFFYWADVVSLVLLAPLFFHFALVFPDRPNAWVRTVRGRTWPLLYLPAGLLIVVRAAAMWRASRSDDLPIASMLGALDRIEHLLLGVGLAGGLAVMGRALTRVNSVTARRQLRWIVWGTALGALPFVGGNLIPFVLGFESWPVAEWLALPLAFVPLAFASAVVRYRLMDVEVIIKRTVLYTCAVAAIVGLYAVVLKLATEVFLGGSDPHNSVIAVLATLVVVLLAPILKNGIQTLLDRAYYRDRYDYRQALVGFARDLNSDLDLGRLSERLVGRVMETLLIDRMALLLRPDDYDERHEFTLLHAEGFAGSGQAPSLPLATALGQRMVDGHMVSLDDPLTLRRFASNEAAYWRDRGLQYFFPCVSKEGTIAVMALGAKESGEPLSSEDLDLLRAVAGQVATALEAGRLYQRLRDKADELERLREFSDNIIASLQDGLLVVDLDDRVVRWNPALERICGIGQAQALGRPLRDLFDGAFLDRLRVAREDRRNRALYRVPMTSRHADGGRKLLVNLAVEPLCTAGGATAGTILLIEDVTSRVRLEEQLQISDKMASIGLLAAGVAHEVNTPLTGIASFTQMLLDRADPESPQTKVLEKIERQTFRAAKIVNGLLNLARPPQTESGPVDLHVVVNDVLSLLDHQFRTSKVQVRKDLQASPSIVMGVEHKLQQVLLNLFLNARDAMPRGGWVSITTSTRDAGVVIEIGDTGSGIPAENLSRIYDPFFTTKPIGQGTGLGLSITYGIVQEHDGTIACESTVGQGTRFSLTFPAAAVLSRSHQGLS